MSKTIVAEKNGWKLEEWAGRYTLSNVFYDGSITHWSIMVTGGAWSFDHWIDYSRTERRAFISQYVVSDQEAKRLIERWHRLEEWA